MKRIVLIVLLISMLAFQFNVPSAMASSGVDVLVYGGIGPQNEVSVAVNPLNSSNIVVGFNDYPFDGDWVASYAYSIDGGSTWTYGGQPPRGNLTGKPYSDPWLAFDSSGYLYYVALSDSANREVFVSVAAPDANGMVGPLGFGLPQIVEAGSHPNDKPAIAVDTTGGTYDGNIYVVWAHRPSSRYGYRIWFRRGRRSFGNIITWDPPQKVVPDTHPGSSRAFQGAQVAVGPNGEVYVAYQRQTSGALDDADAQLFSYSTDGGTTFTRGIFVSSVTPPTYYVSPSRWARHTSFPTLGVSPATGTIFIAWTDRRNGDDDILLSRSVDGGETWLAAPKRVNTDALGNGVDQWHPALTVNSLGTLDIVFYDRRNSLYPANKFTMLYAARSEDEGDTFTNWAVSDTATNPDAFLNYASGSLGDYVGIDSIGWTTYVIWGDGRNGNPSPRDFNSDVYFDKWSDSPLLKKWVVPIPQRLQLFSYITGTLQTITMTMSLLPIEGLNETVTLTAEGVPPGASYKFEPASDVPPFNTTFTITLDNAQEGRYEIKISASYQSGQVTLPIDLVLTSTPYVLLATRIANPGDIITLEGEGFTANSSFEVFFDGELVKTSNVDDVGTIYTDIMIPSDTQDGNHTVMVKDGEGVNATTILRTPIREAEVWEKDLVPPLIGSPSREPSEDISAGQEVTVSVNATDAETGVKNVTFSYTTDNGTIWNDLSMTYNSTTSLYQATIPGQSNCTWVKYRIVAYDNAENPAIEDNDEEYYVYHVIPEFPSLLILPSFMIATLLAVLVYRRKHSM